ncbi:hypothetical protein JXO52_01770 [bacterium]|nr:hypothetical protein [bacterium]
MITSKLEDGVVWFIIDGDLRADEMVPETDKWLTRLDEYAGYITDIRKMGRAPAIEKKKMEERRQQNNTGKPNAILGRDDAMAILAKIYVHFTGARDTRYFTDPEEAKKWLKSFGR